MTESLLLLEEFLPAAELELLRRFATDRQADYVASEVVSGSEDGRRDEQVRRSQVLFDVTAIYPLVVERVLAHLPWIQRRLGQAPFTLGDVELQVTASNDGEWFKPHRDSGDGPVRGRELTFVYYCHREPRAFRGGELRMFGPFADADNPATLGDAVTITPPQNSIVFFPSHYLHEVMPVTCPSHDFADSRFTYNGWLRR